MDYLKWEQKARHRPPPKCLGPCPFPEGRARRSKWPGQRESRPAAEVPERQASAIFLKHEAPSWVQIAGLPRGPSQGLYSVTPRHGQTPSPGLLLSAELCWLWKSAPPPLTGGPGWATGSRGQGGQRAGLHLRTHRDSGVPSVRADGGARRSSCVGPLLQTDPRTAPTSGAVEEVPVAKSAFCYRPVCSPKKLHRTSRCGPKAKRNARDLGVQFQGKQATWPRRLKILH